MVTRDYYLSVNLFLQKAVFQLLSTLHHVVSRDNHVNSIVSYFQGVNHHLSDLFQMMLRLWLLGMFALSMHSTSWQLHANKTRWGNPEVKVSRNGPECRSGKRIVAGTAFRLEFLVGWYYDADATMAVPELY